VSPVLTHGVCMYVCTSVCLSDMMCRCVSADSLLSGCRLRRRMCDPDDVIAGDVGTLTSHRTDYNSLPRDANRERSRSTGRGPSTHRNDRNSSSLVRLDSGLTDESVAISPLSSAFTDHLHDELRVPPAPTIKVDSINTEKHRAMNTNSTTFDSDISYILADSETGRVETAGVKENRTKFSKRKKKKKTGQQKELNGSRTTKTSTRDDDERRPGKDKRTADWQLVNESLWDFDGVKLWRYCAQILGCSGKLHVGADDAETAGATAATRPAEREPGTRETELLLGKPIVLRTLSEITMGSWVTLAIVIPVPDMQISAVRLFANCFFLIYSPDGTDV